VLGERLVAPLDGEEDPYVAAASAAVAAKGAR
jgi:hypothetical protein